MQEGIDFSLRVHGCRPGAYIKCVPADKPVRPAWCAQHVRRKLMSSCTNRNLQQLVCVQTHACRGLVQRGCLAKDCRMVSALLLVEQQSGTRMQTAAACHRLCSLNLVDAQLLAAGRWAGTGTTCGSPTAACWTARRCASLRAAASASPTVRPPTCAWHQVCVCCSAGSRALV